MGWTVQLIEGVTQLAGEALGSWNRTGQLCVVIVTIAVVLAFLLWVWRR